MTKIAIMLGGNLPSSKNAMLEALKKFSDCGVNITAVSAFFKSAAVDCVPGTPDFYDAAFTGVWHGSAAELLKLCQRLEVEAGRPAIHSSRESRILDCDIIFFGTEIINLPELTIPHPRAAQRMFVMKPLDDIAADWLFPGSGGKTVHDIYLTLAGA